MSTKILLFCLGIEFGILLVSCADLATELWGTDIDRFLAVASHKTQKAVNEATVWAYIASGKTLKLLQEQRAKWAGDIAERLVDNGDATDAGTTHCGGE